MYMPILFIMIWVYYIYLCHPAYAVVQYADIAPKVKTGDMILFHALDNINPIFIGSYYGHVGTVYIDPDDPQQIPYIFEAFWPESMPFYNGTQGVMLIPLAVRLNTYRGYCFYKELVNPLDPQVVREFKVFVDYAARNMQYNPQVFANAINKFIFGEALTHKTNCGELVFLSLIKLGLLPLAEFYNNRRHHLIYVSSLQNCVNNKYLEPVYVYANYLKNECNSI